MSPQSNIVSGETSSRIPVSENVYRGTRSRSTGIPLRTISSISTTINNTSIIPATTTSSSSISTSIPTCTTTNTTTSIPTSSTTSIPTRSNTTSTTSLRSSAVRTESRSKYSGQRIQYANRTSLQYNHNNRGGSSNGDLSIGGSSGSVNDVGGSNDGHRDVRSTSKDSHHVTSASGTRARHVTSLTRSTSCTETRGPIHYIGGSEVTRPSARIPKVCSSSSSRAVVTQQHHVSSGRKSTIPTSISTGTTTTSTTSNITSTSTTGIAKNNPRTEHVVQHYNIDSVGGQTGSEQKRKDTKENHEQQPPRGKTERLRNAAINLFGTSKYPVTEVTSSRHVKGDDKESRSKPSRTIERSSTITHRTASLIANINNGTSNNGTSNNSTEKQREKPTTSNRCIVKPIVRCYIRPPSPMKPHTNRQSPNATECLAQSCVTVARDERIIERKPLSRSHSNIETSRIVTPSPPPHVTTGTGVRGRGYKDNEHGGLTVQTSKHSSTTISNGNDNSSSNTRLSLNTPLCKYAHLLSSSNTALDKKSVTIGDSSIPVHGYRSRSRDHSLPRDLTQVSRDITMYSPPVSNGNRATVCSEYSRRTEIKPHPTYNVLQCSANTYRKEMSRSSVICDVSHSIEASSTTHPPPNTSYTTTTNKSCTTTPNITKLPTNTITVTPTNCSPNSRIPLTIHINTEIINSPIPPSIPSSPIPPSIPSSPIPPSITTSPIQSCIPISPIPSCTPTNTYIPNEYTYPSIRILPSTSTPISDRAFTSPLSMLHKPITTPPPPPPPPPPPSDNHAHITVLSRRHSSSSCCSVYRRNQVTGQLDIIATAAADRYSTSASIASTDTDKGDDRDNDGVHRKCTKIGGGGGEGEGCVGGDNTLRVTLKPQQHQSPLDSGYLTPDIQWSPVDHDSDSSTTSVVSSLVMTSSPPPPPPPYGYVTAAADVRLQGSMVMRSLHERLAGDRSPVPSDLRLRSKGSMQVYWYISEDGQILII